MSNAIVALSLGIVRNHCDTNSSATYVVLGKARDKSNFRGTVAFVTSIVARGKEMDYVFCLDI